MYWKSYFSPASGWPDVPGSCRRLCQESGQFVSDQNSTRSSWQSGVCARASMCTHILITTLHTLYNILLIGVMKCILSMIMQPCALACGLVWEVVMTAVPGIRRYKCIGWLLLLAISFIALVCYRSCAWLCILVHLSVALSVHKTGGTLSLVLLHRMLAAPGCCIRFVWNKPVYRGNLV